MITLNITPHHDIGGCRNINEERKERILEIIDTVYLEDKEKERMIISEILYEMLENDLSSSSVNVIMNDNDIFNDLSTILYNWDIDLIKY